MKYDYQRLSKCIPGVNEGILTVPNDSKQNISYVFLWTCCATRSTAL
jgi:hypothetical protein